MVNHISSFTIHNLSNIPLQTINDNVHRVTSNPGKHIRSLKHDLEKKDTENSALHITIADMLSMVLTLLFEILVVF